MKTERVAKDQVAIRFSYDEALVLSDFLARWYRGGGRQSYL
jgi:hypothetical protein